MYKNEIENNIKKKFSHFFYEFSWPEWVESKKGHHSLSNSGIININTPIKTEEISYLLEKIREKETTIQDHKEKLLLSNLKSILIKSFDESIDNGKVSDVKFIKHELNYLCNQIVKD